MCRSRGERAVELGLCFLLSSWLLVETMVRIGIEWVAAVDLREGRRAGVCLQEFGSLRFGERAAHLSLWMFLLYF